MPFRVIQAAEKPWGFRAMSGSLATFLIQTAEQARQVDPDARPQLLEGADRRGCRQPPRPPAASGAAPRLRNGLEDGCEGDRLRAAAHQELTLMPEVADTLSDPDPKVVASIANLLAELPSDRIGDMLAKALDQLYHGVRDKGWSHVAAKQYAVKFGDEVLEAIRASTFSTAGVRLQ
jgi:hypothetical protein